jgi:cbb3-type cytochrome oxidase subunit 1
MPNLLHVAGVVMASACFASAAHRMSSGDPITTLLVFSGSFCALATIRGTIAALKEQ